MAPARRGFGHGAFYVRPKPHRAGAQTVPYIVKKSRYQQKCLIYQANPSYQPKKRRYLHNIEHLHISFEFKNKQIRFVANNFFKKKHKEKVQRQVCRPQVRVLPECFIALLLITILVHACKLFP